MLSLAMMTVGKSTLIRPSILLLGMVMMLGEGALYGSPRGKLATGQAATGAADPTMVAANQDGAQQQPAARPRRRVRRPAAREGEPRRRPTADRPATTRRRARRPADGRARPTRRPPEPPPSAAKILSAGELKTMASDIRSLSHQLAALNRLTVERISRVEPPPKGRMPQQYRVAGEYRLFQKLRRQHEDHPDDLATLIALVDLQRRNHKLDSAETYLLLALALEPLNQALLFILSGLYLEKEEHTSAWGAYREIIYLNPDNAAARLGQGWVRQLEGNHDGAGAIYDAVATSQGATAQVYYYRILNLEARGEYGAAVALAREGLGQYPDHARLYLARAQAYSGLGLLDRAKTDLYDALSLDSDLTAAYLWLGEISLQEGSASTAIRAFKQVIVKEPGSGVAALQLGRAYLMALRFQEAAEEWELLRRLHPDHPGVVPWLSQAYYLQALEFGRQGRFHEALTAQRRAMSLAAGNAPDWVVQALVGAGSAARAHDDLPRSLDYYERAIQSDPFRAESFIGLSRTYRAMQDPVQERAALRQALAIDPRHPIARAELRPTAQP